MAYTSPDLLIYSYPRESFYSLFKQQIRYGEGRARLVRKYRDGLTKETPIPALMFLFFAASPLVVFSFWHFPLIGFIYIALFSLYLLIILVTGLSEAIIRNRIFPGILIAFGIWTTYMGLGWGFLKTIFLPGKFQYGAEMGNGIKHQKRRV